MTKKKEIAIGGQAVIEGVMMRGPEHIATAIRRSDDTIEVKKEKFESITKRKKILGLPILRGFVSLIEMLIIGYGTLNFSASRAEIDWEAESEKPVKQKSESRKKTEEFFSIAFAMILAFLLFAFLPYKIAGWIHLEKQNFYFKLFAGVKTLIFLVSYIWIISLMKDVRRIFQYHGAEHKSVFAHENKDELVCEKVKKYSTLHPRCGTSFIFFVLLISILIFSVIDTIVAIYILGEAPSIFLRLGYHLLFIPLISGVSFEVLKLSGKKMDNIFVKLLVMPGMALQRITTKEPDDKMIEVALVALKSALDMNVEGEHIKFIKE